MIFHSLTPLEQNQDSLQNEEICASHWMFDVALLSVRTELPYHENLHTFCAQE